MKCYANVLESLTLKVHPDGQLSRGMMIRIYCTARYGGPTLISADQDPSLMLTLDNTPAFQTGRVYHQARGDSNNLHDKTLVTVLGVWTRRWYW